MRKTRKEQIGDVARLSIMLLKVDNPWKDMVRNSYGRHAWNYELASLFDVPIGHHLPDEHHEVQCQGIKVVLLTKEESKQRGFSTHRIMEECNGCHKLIPAGRMHQHLKRVDGSPQRVCRNAIKGDSCGFHYPNPCGPEFCPFKGDRMSKQKEQQ